MPAGNKKGMKKTLGSGRKKGTPNKITQSLIDFLEENKLHPAAEALRLAIEAEDAYREVGARHMNGPQYLKAALENFQKFMRFVYPERKATDITTGGDKVQAISFTDYVRDIVAKEQNKKSS